jgi:hypothetical protein
MPLFAFPLTEPECCIPLPCLARDLLVCGLQQLEHLHHLPALGLGQLLEAGPDADVDHHDSTALVVSQRDGQVALTVRIGRHRLTRVHALEQVVPETRTHEYNLCNNKVSK